MAGLEEKLRTQAAAYAPLTALLGTAPFRWYDTLMGRGSDYPAVVVTLVASSDSYVYAGRLATGYSLVQFDLIDTDTVRLAQLEDVFNTFITSVFDGVGIPGKVAYANFVVNRRRGLTPDPTNPPYRRSIDVSVFSK